MNTFHNILLTISMVLLGSTVGAEEPDASTKLWNKMDPLIEKCNASTDKNVIKNPKSKFVRNPDFAYFLLNLGGPPEPQ